MILFDSLIITGIAAVLDMRSHKIGLFSSKNEMKKPFCEHEASINQCLKRAKGEIGANYGDLRP